MSEDIRWKQRFDNYKKALSKLSNAVEFVRDDNNLPSEIINEIANEALIQCFEFTAELAWNVMKDYLTDEGVIDIIGSKDAIRKSLKYGLIEDGQTWLDVIGDRNLVSHTYNESTARALCGDIVKIYYPLFVEFAEKMEARLCTTD